MPDGICVTARFPTLHSDRSGSSWPQYTVIDRFESSARARNAFEVVAIFLYSHVVTTVKKSGEDAARVESPRTLRWIHPPMTASIKIKNEMSWALCFKQYFLSLFVCLGGVSSGIQQKALHSGQLSTGWARGGGVSFSSHRHSHFALFPSRTLSSYHTIFLVATLFVSRKCVVSRRKTLTREAHRAATSHHTQSHTHTNRHATLPLRITQCRWVRRGRVAWVSCWFTRGVVENEL